MSVLLALLLVTTPVASDRSPAAAHCKETCERHLLALGLGSTCSLCITSPDRTAWVWEAAKGKQGGQALRSALDDDDWAVRWAALRVTARSQLKAEKSVLATWVMGAQGARVIPACVTAARVASSQRVSSAELLAHAGADGARAAVRVWEHRDDIRKAVEVELYATLPEQRREALEHLSRFLGRSPGRVVLDAMATRPPASDAVIAKLLADECGRSGLTVEQALLKVARPEDQPLVNRLLAIYSGELDRLRAQLTEQDVGARKDAIAGLRQYGPLATGELKTAMEDPDTGVRLLAARALASAEGRTLAEHVRSLSAGWSSPNGMRPDAQVRWIDLLGHSGERGCGPVLDAIARNAQLQGAVRASAFEGMAGCAPRDALRLVGAALKDPNPEMRAAAVRALGSLPRQRGAEDAAGLALRDSDAAVVASAISVVAFQGQGGHTADVAALLRHPSPEVREAAAKALERLPRGADFARDLASRVKEDDSAAVRGAAVVTLGTLGGPAAMGALTAATRDPDGRVQHLAKESLRRLGFQR